MTMIGTGSKEKRLCWACRYALQRGPSAIECRNAESPFLVIKAPDYHECRWWAEGDK